MEKNCKTCKHETISRYIAPCRNCSNAWASKPHATLLWEPADISPDLCCGITDSVVSQGEKREMFEKVDEWISAKDRLPEHRQRILFATPNDIHIGIYMDKMITQHGDFEKVFMSTDGGHYQLEMSLIQGWQPLPKPPVVE
jgi:hypothetical protein